jgi:hypothetical protein
MTALKGLVPNPDPISLFIQYRAFKTGLSQPPEMQPQPMPPASQPVPIPQQPVVAAGTPAGKFSPG